ELSLSFIIKRKVFSYHDGDKGFEDQLKEDSPRNQKLLLRKRRILPFDNFAVLKDVPKKFNVPSIEVVL
ncbi:hypothetical protein, partial [Klebsiella pneumoniae]|uniref:hypothetical protein n=1 Tax=Klebsiella pneumoniae TaxID=573 RepID=UPI002731662A